MFFTGQNLPLPCRPFPFDPRAYLLPRVSTRLPLSPYCNPLSAPLRQPRCFPLQNQSPLSLFCKDGFQRQFRNRLWPSATFRRLLFPRILTQGRLHCTQHTILRTALQVHTRLVRDRRFSKECCNFTVVAQHQVSTVTGSYTPCHWRAPGNLNPQHPP